jgi:hypothetical protein
VCSKSIIIHVLISSAFRDFLHTLVRISVGLPSIHTELSIVVNRQFIQANYHDQTIRQGKTISVETAIHDYFPILFKFLSYTDPGARGQTFANPCSRT